MKEFKLTTVQRRREGGKFIARSQFYNTLADPVYAGFFFHGEQRYELDLELPRAITEDEHYEILRLMGKKGKPRPKSHTALYNAFMCDAGGNTVGADHKEQLICSKCKTKFSCQNKKACPSCKCSIEKMRDPRHLRYVYYQSIKERKTPGVKAVAVEEKKIDAMLADKFTKELALSPELSSWCLKHVGLVAPDKAKEDAERAKSHQDRRAALELQLSKLLDLRLSRSNMSPMDEEIFQRKEASINNELNALQLSAGPVKSDWLPVVAEQFDLTVGIANIFTEGTREAKKEALSILGSNLTLNAGKVSIVNAETVEALMKGLRTARAINPAFEPRKIVDTTRGNPTFVSVESHLLRR